VTLPPELDRVLRDYERAWQAKDPAGLAELFTEDGFVLGNGRPPVRGRAAIREVYAGAGGALHLRAFAFATAGDVGYILGGYAAAPGTADDGKFTLTLARGPSGRWLIVSDMDNPDRRPAAQPAAAANPNAGATPTPPEAAMDLGSFSISLTVKDLEASRQFYEKLGFVPFHGEAAQNWLMLRNGDHVIGLFQGMFDKNILTFNPGWDQNAQPLPSFTDVRELQRRLKAAGVTLVQEADETTTGPAAFILTDPDGNPILIDQHR
jgi:ketosteroid isomerase-like protein/predicted enzyme related to lactoylglutathione lyase